jgi:hypothetical protein
MQVFSTWALFYVLYEIFEGFFIDNVMNIWYTIYRERRSLLVHISWKEFMWNSPGVGIPTFIIKDSCYILGEL